MRFKNWKFYYTMVPDTATGGLFGATSYHWTQIANIKRDPFEQTVGSDEKSAVVTPVARLPKHRIYL